MNTNIIKERDGMLSQVSQAMEGGADIGRQIVKSISPEKLALIKSNNPSLYKRLMTGQVEPIRVYSPRELNPNIMNNSGGGGAVIDTSSASPSAERHVVPVQQVQQAPKVVGGGDEEMRKGSDYADLKAALIVLLIEMYRETKESKTKKMIRDVILDLRPLYPKVNKVSMVKAISWWFNKGYKSKQIEKDVNTRIRKSLGIPIVATGGVLVGAGLATAYNRRKIKREREKIMNALKVVRGLIEAKRSK